MSIYIAGPTEFKSQRHGIDMIGEFWVYHHIYPLVNVYIAMENIMFLNGYINYINGQFSIAMLNYQRVDHS